MANLDKLLKQIEKNKETENEVKTHQLTIAGETFNIKTMTRKERRDFIYAQETNKTNIVFGDIVKKMKPFIYRSVEELAPLAVKAKDVGYIKCNYDVIEILFEPDQILKIINFISDINNLSVEDTGEEIEGIKKQ